jgi:hypothetical protein
MHADAERFSSGAPTGIELLVGTRSSTVRQRSSTSAVYRAMLRGRFNNLPLVSGSNTRKRLKRNDILIGLCIMFLTAVVTGLLISLLKGEDTPTRDESETSQLSGGRRNAGDLKNSIFDAESTGKAETLVLYSFSHTDFAYHENLLYYLRHGIAEGDGCRHLIVINNSLKSPVRAFPIYT